MIKKIDGTVVFTPENFEKLKRLFDMVDASGCLDALSRAPYAKLSRRLDALETKAVAAGHGPLFIERRTGERRIIAYGRRCTTIERRGA